MQALINVNRSTVRHTRSVAVNLVEAYRALAERGVGLQAKAVARGTATIGGKLTIIDPVLGSVRRINAQATAFAGTVVNGLADQATAIINGVAEVANFAASKRFPGMALAMPVATPVNRVAKRVDGASGRLLAVVAPKPVRRGRRG